MSPFTCRQKSTFTLIFMLAHPLVNKLPEKGVLTADVVRATVNSAGYSLRFGKALIRDKASSE